MKPVLALHIGMPKTGSSAIQSSLAASHKSLAKVGIMYPVSKDFGLSRDYAHHFLNLPLDFARSGPRLLVQKIGRDDKRANAIFDFKWQRLNAAIAQSKPQLVILSSEHLFTGANLPGIQRLVDSIKATFSAVRVIAYVRQPSRHFASALQQHIKFSSTLPLLKPVNYRAPLEAWNDLFPGCVFIRKYDRKSLYKQDITADFMHHAFDGAQVRLVPERQVNETMSAEAAAMMQDFQSTKQQEYDDMKTRAKRRYHRRLMREDHAIELHGQPLLHPHIASYIDQTSVDLIWLRDKHGISFVDVDYALIGHQAAPVAAMTHISDMLLVDQSRLARLAAAMQKPWYQRSLGMLSGRLVP